MNTAIKDQEGAAVLEVRRIVASMAAAMPGTKTISTPGPVIHALLTRHQAMCQIRRVQCDHLLPHGPQPIFAVAWTPGAFVCAECLPSIVPGDGSVANHQCDWCLALVPSLHMVLNIQGLRIFLAGLCISCEAVESGTTHEPTVRD